jgi:hypothetical protein
VPAGHVDVGIGAGVATSHWPATDASAVNPGGHCALPGVGAIASVHADTLGHVAAANGVGVTAGAGVANATRVASLASRRHGIVTVRSSCSYERCNANDPAAGQACVV